MNNECDELHKKIYEAVNSEFSINLLYYIDEYQLKCSNS